MKESKCALVEVDEETENKNSEIYDQNSAIHTFREKLIFAHDDRPERPFVVCRNIDD